MTKSETRSTTGKGRPAREWVPSCFLVMHDTHVSTSIRYSPMHIQRAADVTYRSTIKLYGRSPVQPIWTAESGVMQLDDVFTVESERIAKELGVEKLFVYGEAFNRSPEMPPPTPNIAMNLHVRYGSDDGSLQGQLASFFIFGAPRSVQRGVSYYESFPGARVNAEHALSAYIINPFLRTSGYRVHIVDAKNGRWSSPEYTVKGKGAAEWNSTKSDFPGSPDPVGIIVQSDLKTTSFFATRAADGKMIGLDHGHPFLAQVLQ
jgi:hypothetical protein